MSFTLMRYKNGVPAPIKMSIWDAFKGAPDPKPLKSKRVSVVTVVADQVVVPVSPEKSKDQASDASALCPCCHKIHNQDRGNEEATNENKPEAKDQTKHNKNAKSDTKSDTKDDKNNSKDDTKVDTKGDAKDDKQGAPFSTREQETYTEDDDKKIIEMKSNGSNWKPILEAIGKKSESQLKAHWRQINPAKQENKEKEGDKKSDTHTEKSNSKDTETSNAKQDADAAKKEELEKKKSEGQSKKKQKQETAKAKANAEKDNTDKGKSKKKPSEQITTSSSELKSWSDRYDRQKWLAAASKHFDLTGRRITPESARRLAGGN